MNEHKQMKYEIRNRNTGEEVTGRKPEAMIRRLFGEKKAEFLKPPIGDACIRTVIKSLGQGQGWDVLGSVIVYEND